MAPVLFRKYVSFIFPSTPSLSYQVNVHAVVSFVLLAFKTRESHSLLYPLILYPLRDLNPWYSSITIVKFSIETTRKTTSMVRYYRPCNSTKYQQRHFAILFSLVEDAIFFYIFLSFLFFFHHFIIENLDIANTRDFNHVIKNGRNHPSIFCYLFLHFSLHPETFVLLAELQTICSTYWNRLYSLEGDKFDLERQIRLKEFEVNTIGSPEENLTSLLHRLFLSGLPRDSFLI